ncbi:class I SAM-dependent methyltransferase [Candidatus Dojkabacteria bacterium]|nr:class I SAM-dependent methyltransferase [Candidatus Dojkabacteria bacterium]
MTPTEKAINLEKEAKVRSKKKKINVEYQRDINILKGKSIYSMMRSLDTEKPLSELLIFPKSQQKNKYIAKISQFFLAKIYYAVKKILEKVLDTQDYINKQKSDITGNIDDFDYFDFEDRFRGPKKNIFKTQTRYLNYLKGRRKVLDIGCGRGEFIQLLKNHKIPGKGIDIYGPFVKYCQAEGLDVTQSDAIDYLESLNDNSLDAVTAFHVVEHVSHNYIAKMLHLLNKKLVDKGLFIFETPNPLSVFTMVRPFYLDPGHTRPVHPQTILYLLEKSGFIAKKVLFMDYPDKKDRLEQMKKEKGSSGVNLDIYNRNIKKLNKIIFGAQSYAVIAEKQ